MDNLSKCRDVNKIIHIENYSQNILPLLNDILFDLIYIDGSHLPETVHFDVSNCWKLLKTGGIMWIDNYYWGIPQYDLIPRVFVDNFLNTVKDKYEVIHESWSFGIRRVETVQPIDLNTALVINLDSRPDRWIGIQQRFNGSVLKLRRLQAISKNNIINTGVMACTCSHQLAVRMAKNAGLKRIIVLEDDATIEGNIDEFNFRLTEILSWLDSNPNDWDMFYGGVMKPYGVRSGKNLNLDLGFLQVRSYCAHFMVYNQSVYDLILDYDPRIDTIDGLFFSNYDNLKLVTVYPMLSRQVISKSNIDDIIKNLYFSFDMSDQLNSVFLQICKNPKDIKLNFEFPEFFCLQFSSPNLCDFDGKNKGIFLSYLGNYIQYHHQNSYVWGDKRISDRTGPNFILTYVLSLSSAVKKSSETNAKIILLLLDQDEVEILLKTDYKPDFIWTFDEDIVENLTDFNVQLQPTELFEYFSKLINCNKLENITKVCDKYSLDSNIVLNNEISNGLVINNDGDFQRWLKINDRLKPSGLSLTRISKINTNDEGYYVNEGNYSYLLSYLKVIEIARKNKLPWALVISDDVGDLNFNFDQLALIINYLNTHIDDWDIFEGYTDESSVENQGGVFMIKRLTMKFTFFNSKIYDSMLNFDTSIDINENSYFCNYRIITSGRSICS